MMRGHFRDVVRSLTKRGYTVQYGGRLPTPSPDAVASAHPRTDGGFQLFAEGNVVGYAYPGDGPDYALTTAEE